MTDNAIFHIAQRKVMISVYLWSHIVEYILNADMGHERSDVISYFGYLDIQQKSNATAHIAYVAVESQGCRCSRSSDSITHPLGLRW